MIEAVDDVADVGCQFLSVLLCPLLLEELTGRREEKGMWFVMAACMYIGVYPVNLAHKMAMGMSIGYPIDSRVKGKFPLTFNLLFALLSVYGLSNVVSGPQTSVCMYILVAL